MLWTGVAAAAVAAVRRRVSNGKKKIAASFNLNPSSVFFIFI